MFCCVVSNFHYCASFITSLLDSRPNIKVKMFTATVHMYTVWVRLFANSRRNVFMQNLLKCLILFLEPDVVGTRCFFRSSFACGYTWGNQWTYIYDCKFFLFIAFTYFYWALVWVRLSSIYSGIWLHLTHAATLWLAHRILLKKN